MQSIIVDHLRVAGELARLGPLNKGALLRRDPPSTLRRLFDAFVVDTYKVSRDAGICFTDVNKTAINSLSAILLASVDTVSGTRFLFFYLKFFLQGANKDEKPLIVIRKKNRLSIKL